MPGTLFYEVIGNCEYLPDLESSLEEVANEFSFKEKKLSNRITIADDIVNRMKRCYLQPFTHPLRMPFRSYDEVQKLGDRKVFFFSHDGVYNFCVGRDVEMSRDLFSPCKVSDKGMRDAEKSVKESFGENADFVMKTINDGIKESLELQKKYEEKLKLKNYSLENIIKKDKSSPSVFPVPAPTCLFQSKNPNVSIYYDWVFYPHVEMVIPSSKSYKEFSIDEIPPVVKHELLHTFHRLTTRTNEGKEIWTAQILIPQSLVSCADMCDCVGVDLAFGIENWRNLGSLCKKSVDSYQEEFGDTII